MPPVQRESSRRGRSERLRQRRHSREQRDHSRWLGPRGGRFQPLAAADIEQIHAAVVSLLDELGIAGAPPSMVERVCAHGGRLDAAGRLCFPPQLIEAAIAGLRRDTVLHSRGAGYHLDISGSRVHTGTGGAAPRILDLHGGPQGEHYRETRLADLYDIARIVDLQEHIHFYSRPVVGTDAPDPLALDINTLYASLAGTSKHVCMSISEVHNVAAIADICYTVAGGEAAFRARPFVTVMATHVVPPMRFASDSCEVVEQAVRAGFPVQLISAGQMGATSPVTLAGSLVQAVAESLAGVAFGWLVDPQARLIFAPKPLVSDLRTGAMCGGGGEQAVLMAAAAQMGRHYGLPVSSIAGYSDAKIHDAQAGYEKNLSVALAAHAGCNVISHACGTLASLLGCSLESYLIDNDMLGGVLRSVHGVEVDAETIAAEVIREVATGAGHYLGHEQTLARMESDYVYPQLADRQTPDGWCESGAEDMLQRARRRARQILAEHRPNHIDPAVDAELRRRYEILLPPIESAGP